MLSRRAMSNGLRTAAFLILYSMAAAMVPAAYGPYLRAGIALVIAIGLFLAVDVVRAVRRGEPLSITEEWALYSVRGFVLLILFILVTAAAVDGFRAMTGIPEGVVIPLAVAVGAIVVFGPVVGYYRRRSLQEASEITQVGPSKR